MHQVLYAIGMELTCKLAPRSMHHPEVLPRLKLFEVLANLQEALTFCIHRIPHIPKALAMWALSLIHVLLLSRFSAPTIESRKWRNRLNFLNVSPETYTYPFFQSQCAVYVKLPFHPVDPSHPVCSQHGHFYVGSTGMSASKRDFNRAAKLKLLENGGWIIH